MTARHAMLCRDCEGNGQIWAQSLVNPSDRPSWEECQRCHGTGYEPPKHMPTPRCDDQEGDDA
jgi:DnaJ-class molecular chaperone